MSACHLDVAQTSSYHVRAQGRAELQKIKTRMPGSVGIFPNHAAAAYYCIS